MKVDDFIKIINTDFFTGVPDSQLKALCDYLMDTYGTSNQHHIIAANEGNASSIAAGYYLATGRYPAVYMQNSGLGNTINTLISLLSENVYAIPCIFIIGWRGEPGEYDEPQHIFLGMVTCKLLEDMGVKYCILSADTSVEELQYKMQTLQNDLRKGKSIAFVVRKKALEYETKAVYRGNGSISREEIIQHILNVTSDDLIVCTTGKASRELFETRERRGENHKRDFLTVGSMGHASSIALGISLRTDKKVWCIDGDGAVLMHMGAMGTIGNIKPWNLKHILIDNGAHESVGGMPVSNRNVDYCKIAEGCGYEYVYKISRNDDIENILKKVRNNGKLSFAAIPASLVSRKDLIRPKITPVENKKEFMEVIWKGKGGTL